MARGSPGTFAPSQTTVQSGTFIPTAGGFSSTTTTPRFSNGSHTLRRATATLAEPMRSASRSSSITSLTSPTTAAALGGEDHSSVLSSFHHNNSTGNSIGGINQPPEGGEMTRTIRPLRGPRNPPAEMTEASLRSFTSHRTSPAMQPWSGGGGGERGRGGGGGSGHGGLPVARPSPSQQQSATAAASSLSESNHDSANRSGGGGSNNHTFNGTNGNSRYPYPQQQQQYQSFLQQRQPAELPFRRGLGIQATQRQVAEALELEEE
ncbi:hypothetical protein DFQ27_000255 [Actinomortierella ambigua]|uniref:Uncharacterized protein n=1 Tax=Actinomortierella ambigua TaxID=1343610 RepID=A0A9P6QGT9_9FUNG|nr:hypothetical protein DFQ27_000255 [Actinomortierella ambigua]